MNELDSFKEEIKERLKNLPAFLDRINNTSDSSDVFAFLHLLESLITASQHLFLLVKKNQK